MFGGMGPSQPLVLRRAKSGKYGNLGPFWGPWAPVAGRARKQWIFDPFRRPGYAIFGHFELSESSNIAIWSSQKWYLGAKYGCRGQ